MYNIIVYENKRFGNIRTFVEEGKQEPWFVAADVCRALEVKNARDAVARLDDDEKNTVVLTDGNRGNPNVTVVSERAVRTRPQQSQAGGERVQALDYARCHPINPKERRLHRRAGRHERR